MRKILLPVVLLLIAIMLGNTHSIASNNYLTHLPMVTRVGNVWLGPDGGRPVSLAVDPATPTNVYTGSWGAGVFKSLDAGSSWFPITRGLGNMFINSLAIDPIHPQVLYAGTYHDQIFKSIDGGQSWFWSGTGIQAEAIVYTIAIDPQNTNNLYIGTRGISNNGLPPWNGVLYKSTDAGSTWRPVLQNVGGLEAQDWVYCLTVNPQAPQYIYAATHEHGVYRSINYGESWFYSSEGLETDDDRTGRAILVDWELPNPYRVYYGAWRGAGVYLSRDNGGAWEVLNDGLLGMPIYSMSMSPKDAATIYLSTFSVGILRTTDRGNSWLPRGLSTDDIYTVAINPQNDAILYAGTAGNGLFRSLDEGATWQHSQVGFRNADVTSVVIPSSSEHLFTALFGGGVLESQDGGANWTEINTGLTDKFVVQLVVDPAHPNLIYALTTNGGLLRYDTLIGTGWVYVGEDLPLGGSTQSVFSVEDPRASRETLLDELPSAANRPEGLPDAENLLSMVFSPSSPNVVYLGTGGSGMYKSLNGGRDWFPSGLEGQFVRSVAVDPANANTVYAAVRTDTASYVRASTDGGGNWITLNMPFYVREVYALAVATDGTGDLYAGTEIGLVVYRQATGWTTSGLGGIGVIAVVTDAQHSGMVFVGTSNGAYYSINAGATWVYGPDELAGLTVQSISFDPFQPQGIYFGTKTLGILQAILDPNE
mgnify:CR=1 FL=1